MRLPRLLLERIQQIAPDDADTILDGWKHDRSGSFRVNTLRFADISQLPYEIEKEFSTRGVTTVRPFPAIPWAYLFDRTDEYAIKGTQSFYRGKIYLQSIASLLPALALDLHRDLSVLDICAAPGSKTTQMSALMHGTGSILALEQNELRYDKLNYNIRLQWTQNVKTKNIDALEYLQSYDGEWYQRILLDAPCSAEGRISTKLEKSYGFWSMKNIEKKSALQRELLCAAFWVLKRWGRLVYSTCTLAPEENESVIQYLLSTHENARVVSTGLPEIEARRSGLTQWGEIVYDPSMIETVRILPTRETEGFFIAAIEKR